MTKNEERKVIEEKLADLNSLPKKPAKCDTCGEKAVWEYAPSDNSHQYCDICVPRGCSCNVIDLWDDEATEQHRDDQHRLLPCVEYWYHEDGFEERDTNG